jgi:hypothetical protein
VEGRVPATTRPPNEPTLPNLQKTWELRPRLFVHVLDDSARATGRAIFADYATAQGNPGIPADAHTPISVGAVNASGLPQTYSAIGPPFGEALTPRPDTFLFDELALGVETAQASAGTSLAAALAAGTAASALSAGMPPNSIAVPLRQRPGGILRIR